MSADLEELRTQIKNKNNIRESPKNSLDGRRLVNKYSLRAWARLKGQ